MDSNLDQFAMLLGKLQGNFLTLEFVLRMALLKRENPAGSLESDCMKKENLYESAMVRVDWLSKEDSLGTVIKEYNAQAKHLIDNDLVSLRDSLAHGRIVILEDQFPMRLMKFGRHKKEDTHVEVIRFDEMTEAWFKRQINRLREAIQVVFEDNPGLFDFSLEKIHS